MTGVELMTGKMPRRAFLLRTGGLALTVSTVPGQILAAHPVGNRIGMGTVIFRNRFEQTKPKTIASIGNPLTLLDVPAYYRERFRVRHLEYWSQHFESLEKPYLRELRARVRAVGAELVNVHVDEAYDLASETKEERQRSLEIARQWIEAAAQLGSRAVRIKSGNPGGSVAKSIASLRELNQLCIAKNLRLLTENHFGPEMNPEVHLRIRNSAGADNLYTDPDFGKYPVEATRKSLEKILPYAYVVSAKVVDFNAQGEHISYDFDRCVRMCERAGFKGIYVVEQWSQREQDVDAEKIADWLLERVRANI